MQLLLKLPINKPPFIGLIDDSFRSYHFNNDLPLYFKECIFRLKIEVYSEIVNLKLLSEEALAVREYKNVAYDKEKLKSWLYFTKEATLFNFSHVYLNKGVETVCILQPQNIVWRLSLDQVLITSMIKDGYK